MKRHWPLFLIPLIGFLPLLLAWWLLAHPEWLPKERHPSGHLFQHPLLLQLEPVPGEREQLRGRWLLLLVQEGSCGERCRKRWEELEKVRLLLGRDALRVGLALLLLDREGGIKRPAFFLRGDHRPELEREMGASLAAGAVLILDPWRRAVMWYDPASDLLGLFRDLRRLLRASRL